ncbi:phage tail protein [Providencia sp. T47]|uniref:phage tail protein n=1 Tax=Providencia sp. T47 TaxID=3395376 RepID=UPI0039BD8BA5
MSVIKKPDLKIFAQDAKTGEVETFPDILRGWGVTLDRTAGKPPLEWFNAIGKRVDEWLMYLTQRGVAEWDTTLSYPKTAIVQFNSIVYVSIKETKGEQPDKSQASWSTLGVFLGLGNYYNKTESDKKFQPKGDYAPAGNYQPAGDYATKSELKNGLDGKLNTSSPEAENRLTVKNTGDYAAISLKKNSNNNGERVDIETMPNANNNSLNIIYRDKDGRNVSVTSIPKKTGTTMLVGDFGWGATKKENSIKETDFGINKHRTFGVFYHDSDAKNTPNGHQYGGGIFFGRDPAVSTHMLYSPDWSNRLYMRSSKSASTMNDWAEFYSTEIAKSDRNGHLKRTNFPDELSDYPVGAPIPWPQATAPSGYLVCNGQSFNKTTYPLLAKAYPTGILPDLRGEFLRGLDAGRGVNTGRAVLSAEGDAFRAHNHSVIGEDSGSGTAYFGRGNGSRRTISKDAMNLEGGTETRPRNIAFLYIVRAA